MPERFDAIIIGTGQSGPSLAQRMTREGMKTAIVERKLFGGTCVNVGCIPTKALVASARAAQPAPMTPVPMTPRVRTGCCIQPRFTSPNLARASSGPSTLAPMSSTILRARSTSCALLAKTPRLR